MDGFILGIQRMEAVRDEVRVGFEGAEEQGRETPSPAQPSSLGYS